MDRSIASYGGDCKPQEIFCTGDGDCACWACINEIVTERRRNGWRDAWFGVGLPPILLGGDDGI